MNTLLYLDSQEERRTPGFIAAFSAGRFMRYVEIRSKIPPDVIPTGARVRGPRLNVAPAVFCALGTAVRLDRRRAPRSRRALELPRSSDARVDEVLGDARHPRYRTRGQLGHDPRALQVGVRRSQSDWWISRRPVQPPARH